MNFLRWVAIKLPTVRRVSSTIDIQYRYTIVYLIVIYIVPIRKIAFFVKSIFRKRQELGLRRFE